jgi:hypothetical protein
MAIFISELLVYQRVTNSILIYTNRVELLLLEFDFELYRKTRESLP